MKKSYNSRQGISLVELLLTLGIISIVLLVMFNIFSINLRSFDISRDQGFAQQDVRNLGEYLKKELRYSSKISDEEFSKGRYFSLELEKVNGKIHLIKKEYKGDEEIYKKSFFSEAGLNSVELIFKNKTLLVKLDIKKEKSEKYNITIPLENIKQDSIKNIILSNETNKNVKIFYALAEDTYISKEEVEGSPPIDKDVGTEEKDEDSLSLYPKWDSNTIYTGGEYVKFDKRVFRAREWTKGNKPGEDFNKWFEVSDYWIESNWYEAGSIVIYNGKKYKATEQNRSKSPEQINWAWRPID